jgi:metal-sulfur cluster biosynthetic enzyme
LQREPWGRDMGSRLKDGVIKALEGVVDPETSLDVWRMKLVRDLEVTDEGEVRLTFRPSSVVCPLGFVLGARIKEAVLAVEGVQQVHVHVQGFVYADQLERLLLEMDERRA